MANQTKLLILVILIITLSLFVAFYLSRDSKLPINNTEVSENIPDNNNSETIKIVAFGDSLTAGYGLNLKDSYPSQLQNYLANLGYNVEVINMGVSGETTAGGVRRIDFALEQKPDIIIIGLGGNDALRGLSPIDTASNIDSIVNSADKQELEIVLLGMLAPDNLGLSYTEKFNRIFKDVSEKYNTSLVPFFLQNVALVKNLNQNDGIHPNKDGYKIIIENNIAPVLLPILDKLKSR